MKPLTILLLAIAAAAATTLALQPLRHTPQSQAAAKESAYDRVMRTGTIRCGYYIWPPFLSKDPNTGTLSGLSYDIVEGVGKRLNLKIEWTSEVNFDSMFEGYATGRYDMVCGPIAATPARARASDFTVPIAYAAYYLYAKDGDTRFDDNYAAVNDTKVRYASLDGDMNAILGDEEFPKAEKIHLPNVTSNIDPLMMIATGKADVTTLEPVPANGFIKSNPGKIRQVSGPPVRVMPLTYSIPPGEEKFKVLMNITLQNMVETGTVDKILAAYPEYSSTILRVASPYTNPPASAPAP